MNKKGFTLVELLAVIAILAILVIVAMPNVLSRFNSAKKSSFTTEVQTVIKEAQTQFVQDKITKSGSIEYYSDSTDASQKLNMSGNAKNYGIKLDTNGNITDIIVWDDNYCWAKSATAGVVGTDVKSADVVDTITGNATSTFTCKTN